MLASCMTLLDTWGFLEGLLSYGDALDQPYLCGECGVFLSSRIGFLHATSFIFPSKYFIHYLAMDFKTLL